MAKYSRDLSEDLVEKVKQVSLQFGLKEQGVRVEAVRMESDKDIAKILKPNDIVKLFTGEENVVAVALNEEVFDTFDESATNIVIRDLLDRIRVQPGKEGHEDEIKIKVEKPQLNLRLATYRDYGKTAVEVMEAALMSLDLIVEQKKAEKEAKAQQKRGKKNKNANF